MKNIYEVFRSKDIVPIRLLINNGEDSGVKLQRQLEIVLVLRGSITVNIRSDSYRLKEDDIFIINNGSVYSIEKEREDVLYLSLLMDKSYFGNYYENFNTDYFSAEKLKEKDLLSLKHYIAKIIYVLSEESEGYELSLVGLSFLLAELLVKKCTIGYENLNMEKDKHMDRLERILDFMDNNFDNNITLVQVAEYENLSMYYTSHFIKKYLGMSFQEYINMKRLEKSMYLLLKTNKTIGDISRESGFPSPKALNNLFNKYYSETPSQFRKKGKGLKPGLNVTDIEDLVMEGKLEKYLEFKI